jgi:hypothetical protein
MGTKRRRPWINLIKVQTRNTYITYHKDLRAASIVIRKAGCRSTQEIIDTFGRGYDVRRCMTQIDVDHLLPQMDAMECPKISTGYNRSVKLTALLSKTWESSGGNRQ